MTRILVVIAAAILGISAGASLAEAVLLVPFWKELGPAEFFDWYANNRLRLVQFYSPLQILSAVTALIAFIWLTVKKQTERVAMLVSLTLAIAVLILFPAYFKDANASFAERTVAPDQLAIALDAWGRWQWARVALASAAFLSALWSMPGRRNGLR